MPAIDEWAVAENTKRNWTKKREMFAVQSVDHCCSNSVGASSQMLCHLFYFHLFATDIIKSYQKRTYYISLEKWQCFSFKATPYFRSACITKRWTLIAWGLVEVIKRLLLVSVREFWDALWSKDVSENGSYQIVVNKNNHLRWHLL